MHKGVHHIQTLAADPSSDPANHIGCVEGTATYHFHDKWTCRGDAACDVWANSDAFEQGSFAKHLLESPAWQPHITMADAAIHNSPCASYDEASQRDALACHFLAEYKDQIEDYIDSRTKAAQASSKVAIAQSQKPTDDHITLTIGPMVRTLTERVAPFFSLASASRPEPATLCHVGAGNGLLAEQLAARLRLPTVAAFDAAAMPSSPDALVRSFNGKDIPRRNGTCAATLLAYHLHKAAAAHVTPQLLREAKRVTRGYVLLAEDRAGRTVAEAQRNTALEPHGTFRSLKEWQELFGAAGLEVLAAGPMFAPASPQIFLIARPDPSLEPAR